MHSKLSFVPLYFPFPCTWLWPVGLSVSDKPSIHDILMLFPPPGDLWGAMFQVVQDGGAAWLTVDYSWVRNQTFVVLSHWVFRRLSTLTIRANFSDKYNQKYNNKTNTRKQNKRNTLNQYSIALWMGSMRYVFWIAKKDKEAGYFAGSKVKWKQFRRFLLPQ